MIVMAQTSTAELDRRAREWLHVETSDQDFNAAFAAAQAQVDPQSPDDVEALIALGEFVAARRLIPALEPAERFLHVLGRYFAASGDDALARALWPRVVAAARAAGGDADTQRAIALVAESIGEAPVSWMSMLQKEEWSTGFISAFAGDILGYAPDAYKGRLRLRPDFPQRWNAATVRNIHMGDSLIQLQYEQEAGCMRFRVEQVAGAVPVTLIFEPLLTERIESVSVDGVPADLNISVVGGRVVAPVQIVLDAARHVELTTGAQKNPPL